MSSENFDLLIQTTSAPTITAHNRGQEWFDDVLSGLIVHTALTASAPTSNLSHLSQAMRCLLSRGDSSAAYDTISNIVLSALP